MAREPSSLLSVHAHRGLCPANRRAARRALRPPRRDDPRRRRRALRRLLRSALLRAGVRDDATAHLGGRDRGPRRGLRWRPAGPAGRHTRSGSSPTATSARRAPSSGRARSATSTPTASTCTSGGRCTARAGGAPRSTRRRSSCSSAHAFETCGFGRVKLQTDVVNARSRAAILKLGATFEGITRRDVRRPDGSWRDSAVHSILVDEWPTVRAGLLTRLG